MAAITPEQVTTAVDTLPVVGTTVSGGGLVAMFFWLRSIVAGLRAEINEAKKSATGVKAELDKLEDRIARAEDHIDNVRMEHARIAPELEHIKQDLDEIKQMMRDALDRQSRGDR